MKKSSIFILSIALCFQLFGCSTDSLEKSATINETLTYQSDVQLNETCDNYSKSSSLSVLKPGFYVIDNAMYDVVENASKNASLDEKKYFLPLSIIHSIEIKPYISDTEYHLTLQPTFKGAKQINALTRDNIGRYIALIINDEVLIAARVLSPLSDSFYITGIESLEDAENIQAKIECALRL